MLKRQQRACSTQLLGCLRVRCLGGQGDFDLGICIVDLEYLVQFPIRLGIVVVKDRQGKTVVTRTRYAVLLSISIWDA